MTAMEIYREDRQNRKKPEERLPRQEYFALLRDTLHDELMRQGRSEFLDEMLAECSGGRALPMLEFAALRECYEMIVENQPMQDASEFVPHIYRTQTERFAWRELGQSAYRVDNPEFPQLLTRLRTVSQQLVSVRDETLAPEVNRAAQREIEGLMTLNRTLESDNTRLRQEREELKARIAALEEGFISDQLRQRLENRRRQAEHDLEEELCKRRQEAEDRLRRQIGDAAETQHRARLDADRAAEESAARRTAEYASLQEGMRARVEALQAQLESQFSAWQGQLYAADHRFLAGSCASLMATAHRETARLMAAIQRRDDAETLMAEAAQWQAALDTQLRQLEQALCQLGMRIFWPEEGETFDSRLHSPASARAEDAQGQAVIDHVETPGVMLAKDAAQPGETLVRAVVRIRPTSAAEGL